MFTNEHNDIFLEVINFVDKGRWACANFDTPTLWNYFRFTSTAEITFNNNSAAQRVEGEWWQLSTLNNLKTFDIDAQLRNMTID